MIKKPIVIVLCLLPLLILVDGVFFERFGPDAGKYIVLSTGFWSITLLGLTLAVSTVQRRFRLSGLIRNRRMLGLFTFFYATLHLVAVMTFILGWSWTVFLDEFQRRPYMAIGIIAWLLLLPLAITSNRLAMKLLGPNWKRLHSLVYLIVGLSMAHFIWMVRSDYGEQLLFAVLFVVLIIERINHKYARPIKKASVFERVG